MIYSFQNLEMKIGICTKIKLPHANVLYMKFSKVNFINENFDWAFYIILL